MQGSWEGEEACQFLEEKGLCGEMEGGEEAEGGDEEGGGEGHFEIAMRGELKMFCVVKIWGRCGRGSVLYIEAEYECIVA